VECDGIGVLIKEEAVIASTEEEAGSIGIFYEWGRVVVAVVVEVTAKEDFPVGVVVAVFSELLGGDPLNCGGRDEAIVIGMPDGVGIVVLGVVGVVVFAVEEEIKAFAVAEVPGGGDVPIG